MAQQSRSGKKSGRQSGQPHRQAKFKAHPARLHKSKDKRVNRSSHGKYPTIEAWNIQKKKVESEKE